MITGAVRGTPSEKRFNKLDLESLKLRRWLRILCLINKISLVSFSVRSTKQ